MTTERLAFPSTEGTPSTNAAAYGLLRSIMTAADDDELIDRNPVGIAEVQNEQKAPPVDEIATIVVQQGAPRPHAIAQ